MKPLFPWSLPILYAVAFLSACQTPQQVREDRGRRMAGVLDGFIVSHRRLPASPAELLASAETMADRTAIRALHGLRFRAVGTSTARAYYTDAQGVPDHYTVRVCARPPLHLTSGTESWDFADPHFLMSFRVYRPTAATPKPASP